MFKLSKRLHMTGKRGYELGWLRDIGPKPES